MKFLVTGRVLKSLRSFQDFNRKIFFVFFLELTKPYKEFFLFPITNHHLEQFGSQTFLRVVLHYPQNITKLP